MVAANSLQNRAYQIILSQWGSSDEILQGETGRRRERTFRGGHLLLLWKEEVKKHLFIFLKAQPVPHLSSPKTPYSVCQVSWWKQKNSKQCAECIGYLSWERSVDIVMVILCKMILPICPSGPRIPQFTRKWIQGFFYNFFSVRESPGFCHTNRDKAIYGWWLSLSVKDVVHLPPPIGSSPLIHQVSDPQR